MKRPIEEIMVDIVDSLEDDPISTMIPAAQKAELADTLATVKGLPEYLKKTMSSDVRRYFSAPADQQQYIKGAFHRTLYLLSLTVPKQQYESYKTKLSL